MTVISRSNYNDFRDMWIKGGKWTKIYAICTEVSYAMKMNMENDEKRC